MITHLVETALVSGGLGFAWGAKWQRLRLRSAVRFVRAATRELTLRGGL